MNQVDIKLNLPKPPSLNKLYSQKHWAVRKKIKDDYNKEILRELGNYDAFTCESYRLFITYNARLDVDNVILLSKFVSDCLVKEGYVQDDSPKFYGEIRIRYKGDLKKDQFIAVIKCNNFQLK